MVVVRSKSFAFQCGVKKGDRVIDLGGTVLFPGIDVSKAYSKAVSRVGTFALVY